MIQVGEAQKQAVRFRVSPVAACTAMGDGLVDWAMVETEEGVWRGPGGYARIMIGR